MSNLITPETFEFFARYLLAGFIVVSVRGRFVVGERPKPTEMAFEIILLSLVNQFVFLLFSSPISFAVKFVVTGDAVEGALFYTEVLIVSSALGLLFGWNLSQGWNHALLRRLAMPVQHPVRRAYDFAFTHERTEGFVIITFVDGTVIHGFFGQSSLAANDSERSDIYLERLYDVEKDGQWTEKPIGRSALISLEGLRSIEFLDSKE